MQIKILSIAKTKDDHLKEGEAIYLERLSKEVRISCVSLDVTAPPSMKAPQAKEWETNKMLHALRADEHLILLDERGTNPSSEEFSRWIKDWGDRGLKHVTFAIGGPFGWSDAAFGRAQQKLSLSKLTFPYQLARLILLEQIYRGYSILRGSPYHRA